MLRLPDKGILHSVNVHRSSLNIACDWLESSLLFDEDCDVVYRQDGVDQLVDSGIYDDQNFAEEFIVRVWRELYRRCLSLGSSCPYEVSGKSIRRRKRWRTVPAHAFCMALSLERFYDLDWASPLAGSYAAQGVIFERIAEASLRALGWSVLRTGWSSGQSNVRLPEVVQRVSRHLNEPNINDGVVHHYRDKNEHGLDLVISRPFFRDERGGKPTYLVQCASGDDEKQKRSTPDMATWRKFIGFSANPARAFVVPFAYEEEEFFRLCSEVDGMVVERYRLLSAGMPGKAWLPNDLKSSIAAALKARLPEIESLRAF